MTAKSLTHQFTSSVVDSTDPSLVKPSAWNSDHNLWLGYRSSAANSDPLTNADHLSLVTYTNAGAAACSIPAPTGGNFPLGWHCRVRSAGVGGVTITGTGAATINGNPSISLAQFDAVDLYGTGTNDFQAVAVRATSGVSSLNTLTGGLTLVASNTPAGTRGGIGVASAGSTITLTRDPPAFFENLSISATVAANILTVTLKDASGNPLSGSSSGRIAFQDPTTGLITCAVITAPVSISTVVGASFGQLANNAMRIWLAALLDTSGNTVLGLFANLQMAVGVINHYGLAESGTLITTNPMSSTANSAGPIYTPAGVILTNRPWRVLASMEYNPGDIATPGSYPIAPRTIHLLSSRAHRIPGDVVQRTETEVSPGNVQTTSTTPVLTGSAINISLDSPANIIRVYCLSQAYMSVNTDVVLLRLCRGNTPGVGTLGGVIEIGAVGTTIAPFHLRFTDFPNASSMIYSMQFNSANGQTVAFSNGQPVTMGFEEIMV